MQLVSIVFVAVVGFLCPAALALPGEDLGTRAAAGETNAAHLVAAAMKREADNAQVDMGKTATVVVQHHEGIPGTMSALGSEACVFILESEPQARWHDPASCNSVSHEPKLL